jgi:AcrR family transcriptional regulator
MTTLTPDAVTAAGVTLVAERGVGALGVRPVAARLGVTPMALYRHAASGEALTTAVIERIVAELPVPGAEPDWQGAFRCWAQEARAVLARYPGLAAHLLTSWFRSPGMLAVVEGLLAVAGERPGGRFERVASSNAVLMYVLMRAQAEQSVREAGVVRRELADRDRPLLRAHRDEYTTAKLDEHFAYGLDALLAGLAR